jgi:hypothetical protein
MIEGFFILKAGRRPFGEFGKVKRERCLDLILDRGAGLATGWSCGRLRKQRPEGRSAEWHANVQSEQRPGTRSPLSQTGSRSVCSLHHHLVQDQNCKVNVAKVLCDCGSTGARWPSVALPCGPDLRSERQSACCSDSSKNHLLEGPIVLGLSIGPQSQSRTILRRPM